MNDMAQNAQVSPNLNMKELAIAFCMFIYTLPGLQSGETGMACHDKCLACCNVNALPATMQSLVTSYKIVTSRWHEEPLQHCAQGPK